MNKNMEKNILYIMDHNLTRNCQILIIFGTGISDVTGYKMAA